MPGRLAGIRESARNAAMPRYRKPAPPVPSLWVLNREPHWLWVHCGALPRCMLRAPMAIAPLDRQAASIFPVGDAESLPRI